MRHHTKNNKLNLIVTCSTVIALELLSACAKKSAPKSNEGTLPNPDEAKSTAGTVEISLVPTLVLASVTGASAEGAQLLDDPESALDRPDPKRAAKALDDLFANAADIRGCLAGAGRMQELERSTSCYGPVVKFTGHPDGFGPFDYLPRGDLGVFEESEGANNEACVAAKMNEMIGRVRGFVSEAVETSKRALCFARVLGKTLPTAIGSDIDLTKDVSDALAANSSEVDRRGRLSYGVVKIKLIARTGDIATYQTDVDAMTKRGSVWTRVVNKREGAKDTGYVWGVFKPDLSGQDGDPHVFSVLYSKDGDTVAYDATKSRAKSDLDKAALTADKVSLFDTNRRVRVDTQQDSGYDHILAKVDTNANDGEMVYMWTAGIAAEEQRTLHAKVISSGANKTGWGYFGFGPKLADFRQDVKDETVSDSAKSIRKMICNWAGPQHSHVGEPYAQKQVLSLTNGYFTAAESHIGFAGRNNCGRPAAEPTFKVVKVDSPEATPSQSSFHEWAPFDLVSITSGADADNLKSIKSLLLDSSL